jgi:hypothetical protein
VGRKKAGLDGQIKLEYDDTLAVVWTPMTIVIKIYPASMPLLPASTTRKFKPSPDWSGCAAGRKRGWTGRSSSSMTTRSLWRGTRARVGAGAETLLFIGMDFS